LESSQFIAEKLVKYGITHPSGVTSHSPSAPEIRLRPLVAPWPPGKISVPFAPLEPPKSKYERGTEVCQTVRIGLGVSSLCPDGNHPFAETQQCSTRNQYETYILGSKNGGKSAKMGMMPLRSMGPVEIHMLSTIRWGLMYGYGSIPINTYF